MKNPVSQALYAYWSSLCRGRCAPDRHELDPAQMRGLLAYTFMLEVDEAETTARRYPIRISGTRFDAFFGSDLKGRDFADLWAPDDRVEMRALLEGVLDDAQPAVASMRTTPDDRAATCELLLLPLRHHGRTHARLLCSLVPHGTPAWLGLRPIGGLSLLSWRAIDGASEALREQQALRSGLETAVRRSHLIVHNGGRCEPSPAVGFSQSPVKAGVRRLRDIHVLTRSS